MPDEPVELTGDALREWMDAGPVAQCDVCHRKTWAEIDIRTPCLMPQPDGSRCVGRFEELVAPREEER